MTFMHSLDDTAAYQVITARDARLDGRLFVGVTSTGIYCRPICPARTPKESNCRFFSGPQEAENAHFRPCLRCRPELAPEGMTFEAESGKSLCDNLLDHGIEIEHACEKSCACTTCHVIVREGGGSLNASTDDEDDLLDRAWGLSPQSRLSCQAIVADQKLVVEIPRYTINFAKERK